jgi:serine/threonine-protein kinase RsbW
MATKELSITFIGNLNHLGTIRDQIRDFAQGCRFSKPAIDEIELAVDEAVANVILHAYAPSKEGLVEMRAKLEHGAMTISIRDFGRSYKPRPLTVLEVKKIFTSRKSHGRGRYIMQQCMDSVSYKSVAKQYNETIMVKRLPRSKNRQ